MAIISFLSCDDYVDIEPRGSAIAASLEDINALLDNAMVGAQTVNILPSLLSDNLQLEDPLLELASSDINSTFITNAYNLEPLFFTRNETDLTWATLYRSIGHFNNIIAVLQEMDVAELSAEDNALRMQYLGEAKVHRAYGYFYLVNIYGVHYGLPEASNSESGVPLLTVFGDDMASLERASVNEVYEFIWTDLNNALPFLPNRNISIDRASSAAASGLLGEVEMHRGNYEAALSNLNDALAINNTLIDYKVDTRTTGIDNPEGILLKTSRIPSLAISFNTVALGTFSDELLAIVDRDNDLRFAPDIVAENEFGNFGIANDAFEFNLGVTVPRLMLFKAECLARGGNFTAAMDVVNDLREKRFETSFVAAGNHMLTATNQEEALAHIMEETRREFNVSGQRFFDVKRLNAIENAGISLTRNGTVYAPNSINWAAPIAAAVINTSNGQIKQNERE